jgi:DNA polymerase-3 subunit delta'
MLRYADKSAVRMNTLEMDSFIKFSMMINEANCHDFAKELNTAYMHIERNANPKILFLDLSFKLGKLLRKTA